MASEKRLVDANKLPEGKFVDPRTEYHQGWKRIVIPCASVTEMEAITYKDNEPIGYGITLSAEPGTDGAYHHEYIQGTVPTTTTS